MIRAVHGKQGRVRPSGPSNISAFPRAGRVFHGLVEAERPVETLNRHCWRSPIAPRWESRPGAHPTAIYASCLPFSGSVLLPYVSLRRINEDERCNGGMAKVEEREESRTRPEGREERMNERRWIAEEKKG